jgi:hypothetical protein
MTKLTHEMEERMDSVRYDLLKSMQENDLGPNEAMTVLTSTLVEIYANFVENRSKENFTDTLAMCYDAYILIKAEPEGSIQ